MEVKKKEIVLGVMFAMLIALFLNFTSIERLLNSSREFNISMIYPLIFSVVWFFVVSMIYYLLFLALFNIFYGRDRDTWMVVGVVILMFGVSQIFVELYPVVRGWVLPEDLIVHRPKTVMPTMGGVHDAKRMIGVPRGFSSRHFVHSLVAIFTLAFVVIQRLLYRNQEIERHNEQLHLESVKSQHSALVQQINPHFFFNSLGSLRYIILKGESDDAVEFLDNLTSIFRKTLKLSANTLHTLREEMELTSSYMHIIERRFAGKISVSIDVEPRYENYMLSPLSILTLMENIIKHNAVSSKNPIRVSISIVDGELVVENNIVPKYDEVESNGIGLINLNKQYELLTGRGIDVMREGGTFRVKLPLLKPEQ